MNKDTELSLGQKQRIFAGNVGILINFAYANGYELTLGQALRTRSEASLFAQQGTGVFGSLHLISLAIDLNLFRNGVYLTKSEDHKQLGEYWKSLHSLNRWGGDFHLRPDGNHYSMEHNGTK